MPATKHIQNEANSVVSMYSTSFSQPRRFRQDSPPVPAPPPSVAAAAAVEDDP